MQQGDSTDNTPPARVPATRAGVLGFAVVDWTLALVIVGMAVFVLAPEIGWWRTAFLAVPLVGYLAFAPARSVALYRTGYMRGHSDPWVPAAAVHPADRYPRRRHKEEVEHA